MASNRKVLVLPGDGIGPEVMRQVGRVAQWMDRKRIASFDLTEDLVGGAAYDAHGTPLADSTLKAAMAADAVLFGAVGGPKWDNLPFALKPERGLLRLRKEMELFANLRPAMVFEPLIGASTLRPEIVRDLGEITRAGVDASDSQEANESALAELVEFVRVGVQLVFDELQTLRDHEQRPPRHSLH